MVPRINTRCDHVLCAMAPHTITLAVGAVSRCKANAGLRRSPRGLHTRTRLSSLLRLNLDSSLKTTWFRSAAVQFSREQYHSKRRCLWVGVKGSSCNGCCCNIVRVHYFVRGGFVGLPLRAIQSISHLPPLGKQSGSKLVRRIYKRNRHQGLVFETDVTALALSYGTFPLRGAGQLTITDTSLHQAPLELQF
ncbi:uncharacterized protein TNCV_2448141 [Trichonephila clavipes]|uniref:Uncharacterized protein n=1 Tax=Trichonephila clavipes TaxID=2585209 RepID=A0A8X6VLQ9_TRICX|nr:uncharacterized protein TNCV_2448141 [Trichonephila clavipes]